MGMRSWSASAPAMLVLALLLSTVGAAGARGHGTVPDRGAPPAPLLQEGLTEVAELEAFLDQLMAEEMDQQHLAGAAVSVVKGGKLFFAKGYGQADVEQGLPVDPERTAFGVGSVGKVFTWTAVMQLFEQGKLDLDEDINTYLDFRIPDTYPQPITLKHLMTHTSGFENRLLNSAVFDAAELVPPRDWLLANMHARVRPPGEYAGYSNFNAMLAGYIVTRVSGQPYDQYIQEHIFDPLGMTHSLIGSSIPADRRDTVSKGYTFSGDRFQRFRDYLVQPAVFPSGAHHSSVSDMARFMIAQLEGGRYSDAAIPRARILKEATVRQMHSTVYLPAPGLMGTAYGLFDFSDNGQHTLGHSGELTPMHSLLLLLPEQHVGVFVAYNSAGGSELTNQHLGFQRAFFDHYFPAPAVPAIQAPPDFGQRAVRYVGSYRWTMRSYTTLMKIIGLFGTAEVTDPGDGALLVSVLGLRFRFVEVEPLFFRQEDGPFGLAFKEDEQGRITHMVTDLMPQFAFERLEWYETVAFNQWLLLGCVLLFLSTIPVISVRFYRDRRHLADRAVAPPADRRAEGLILAICVLNLLFLVGNVMWSMLPIMNLLLQGPPMLAKVAMGIGVLSALLTVVAVVKTASAWKNGTWSLAFRATYTLVTVAAVAFVWFLAYWNQLGWRY